MSAEFHSTAYPPVRHVLKLQLLVPFAIRVEVDPGDATCNLAEANVVESFEASAGYRLDAVVGDQELLLPPHEYVFLLDEVLEAVVGLLRGGGVWLVRGEPAPVLVIDFRVGA